MKKFLILLFPSLLFGQEVSRLHLGLDEKQMLVSFEIKRKDIKQFHDKYKKKWISQVSQFLTFEKRLGCQFSSPKWSIQKEILEGEAEVNCRKSMKGTQLKINLGPFFPEIKSIRVKVLSPPKGHDQTYDASQIKIIL
ncbi:MAG: hypothetical protein OEY33_07210 [Bdellovibrionales bacterium]|jgi:hypothetical protein|nr:hypothetical protein [Bdellovibrionales bacterium]